MKATGLAGSKQPAQREDTLVRSTRAPESSKAFARLLHANSARCRLTNHGRPHANAKTRFHADLQPTRHGRGCRHWGNVGGFQSPEGSFPQPDKPAGHQSPPAHGRTNSTLPICTGRGWAGSGRKAAQQHALPLVLKQQRCSDGQFTSRPSTLEEKRNSTKACAHVVDSNLSGTLELHPRTGRFIVS